MTGTAAAKAPKTKKATKPKSIFNVICSIVCGIKKKCSKGTSNVLHGGGSDCSCCSQRQPRSLQSRNQKLQRSIQLRKLPRRLQVRLALLLLRLPRPRRRQSQNKFLMLYVPFFVELKKNAVRGPQMCFRRGSDCSCCLQRRPRSLQSRNQKLQRSLHLRKLPRRLQV